MKSRWSRYSSFYAGWALVVWGVYWALLTPSICEWIKKVMEPFFGTAADSWLFILLAVGFFGLPWFALMIHGAAWLVPGLRRRWRPHWSTHGIAVLAVAPPVVACGMFFLYNPGQQQVSTPVAQQRILPMEEEYARQLYPVNETRSLREARPFTETPMSFNLPKAESAHGEIPPYEPVKGEGVAQPERTGPVAP